MKLLELKEFIEKQLPEWFVTIDEAEMMNVDIDSLCPKVGAIYIEEFVTGSATVGMKIDTITRYDVTFFVTSDIEPKANERQAVREERIDPCIHQLMKDLYNEYNVSRFTFDSFPRGFDVAGVSQTMTFEILRSTAC